MAPQSKREAEASDEVCKRLKEDLKKEDEKVDAVEPIKNSDDNSKLDATNGSTPKSNDQSGDSVQANGEKNKSEATNASTEASSSEEKSIANGDEKDKKVIEKTSEVDSTTKEDDKNQEAAKEAVAEEEDEGEEEEEEEEEVDTTGTLLLCGGANWEMTGRKDKPKNMKPTTEAGARNLWGPHKVLLEAGGKPLRVRGVFSGCNAFHSVIITEDGEAMTFGRNDRAQLGLGDTETRVAPAMVEGLKDLTIVAAACGRSHTLFLTDEGVVYSCGDNKMGQCGTNQQSVHTIYTPQRVAFGGKRIVKMSCGAEFSMIVDEDGRLYSFGHPEHGQLGHDSEGKYFTSGNKYAFHCEYQPRRIISWREKSRDGHVSEVDNVEIVDVACGTNHTLAVDKRNRCFSWGFAGYHRLGHSETKNELVPRSVKLFDAPMNSGRGCARVYAGSSFSMALDQNGLLYFWGQNKSSGEATMYPKAVQDLCGWRIRAVACAARSIFVVAEDACISWGPSPTYGELGYGEGKSKSSTTPQEVRTLDGVHVMDVSCGYGHTLLIGRDHSEAEKKLISEQFESWP